MKLDELKAKMDRVAVALGRMPGSTFQFESRPFGNGWAVFILGDFDTRWLEKCVHGDSEFDACDRAWQRVLYAIGDERANARKALTEVEGALRRKQLAFDRICAVAEEAMGA